MSDHQSAPTTIDSEVEARILTFLSDNLHIILEDEGDQSEIPSSKFAKDLAAQLTNTIAQEANKAREKAIIDATGGLAIPNLMNHQKNRSTAFKKYAIKFFNTKIKERRERMLGASVSDLPTEGDHSAVSGDLEAQA